MHVLSLALLTWAYARIAVLTVLSHSHLQEEGVLLQLMWKPRQQLYRHIYQHISRVAEEQLLENKGFSVCPVKRKHVLIFIANEKEKV